MRVPHAFDRIRRFVADLRFFFWMLRFFDPEDLDAGIGCCVCCARRVEPGF